MRKNNKKTFSFADFMAVYGWRLSKSEINSLRKMTDYQLKNFADLWLKRHGIKRGREIKEENRQVEKETAELSRELKYLEGLVVDGLRRCLQKSMRKAWQQIPSLHNVKKAVKESGINDPALKKIANEEYLKFVKTLNNEQ